MSGINSRSVCMSLMIMALLVVFFPAGSVQAAGGMCTDCKCDYTCESKSKNIEMLYKTLKGCMYSKQAFEGECRLCEGIDVCTQTGIWFKKCEDAGGSYVRVKCLCSIKDVPIQKPYTWYFGCRTKNTKWKIGPGGMPVPY